MKRFMSFDGIRIAYYDWGTPDGSPPVILHHGFMSDANGNWRVTGVVDALLAAGRWVLAPDARGHGQSDKPYEQNRYGEQAMARDLTVLMDIAGTAEVDLVGYSMGSVVAAIAASQDARVRHLVLGGIGASLHERGGVDGTATSRQAVATVLLAEDPSPFAATPLAAFRAFAEATGADRRAMAAQAMAAHATPFPLADITAPTLVIAGREDALATRPEVLVAAIPGARLLLLDGDHLGAVRDPGFAPAIVDFTGVRRADLSG
jgi:pimeloyl-ACP methyl ester carboxylesterase